LSLFFLMMQPLLIRFLFILVLLNSYFAKSQILPVTADFNYLYQSNAEIQLRHQLVYSNQMKWLFLEINFIGIPFDSLSVNFQFTEKPETSIVALENLALRNYQIYESGSIRRFAIEVNENKYSLLVLHLVQLNSTNSFTYIINLSNTASFYFTEDFFTEPILSGYATKDAIVKLNTLNEDAVFYKAQFYANSFSPALPPMATSKTSNPLLKPDTTYQIKSGEYMPTNKIGAYTIVDGVSDDAIVYFRVVDNNYPLLTSINDLIDASIYLFTKNEKEKINKSTLPKKEYDMFWLENTGSPERASKMISTYFSRVKEANIKFTSFKEGWKTDMGMIYIIFGPPSKVFRTDKGMQWVYNKTFELPEITFTFYISNVTTEYYVLERNVKFQSVWYRAVDLWRKGRKNM